MNKLLTSQLYEGCYITKEAFLDEKYILLSPEIPVEETLIDRLRRWSFDYLQTDGEVSEDSGQTAGTVATGEDAPLAAIDHGRKDEREMADTQKRYAELVGFTQQLFGNLLRNDVLPINPIHEKTKVLLEDIRERKRYILRVSELGNVGSANYLVDHAVKTAIVAMATGISMKLPPHRLMDLGTAGLLHEIGMARLPSALYMSDRELTEREKKAVTTHPVLAFKILKQFDFPMQICLAVLECRENVDGSGYPRRLVGDKLSLYGKVLNAASTFAAMASSRPYRPPIDGHTIMKTLLGGVNSVYDNGVLQAMIETFSLFPYGTYVKLTSGHLAMVVDVVPGKAREPQVRILTDAAGTPVKEQPVVETSSEQYSVAGVLSIEDVTRLKSENPRD